jgi:D-alanyl-D-alanine carboxypeptidase
MSGRSSNYRRSDRTYSQRTNNVRQYDDYEEYSYRGNSRRYAPPPPPQKNRGRGKKSGGIAAAVCLLAAIVCGCAIYNIYANGGLTLGTDTPVSSAPASSVEETPPPNFLMSEVELAKGESLALSERTVSDIPSSPLSWTSSDEGVLSVDANGGISALSEGTATVTARDENGNVFSQSVTVKKPDYAALYPDLPAYDEPLPIANYENPLSSDFVPKLVTVKSVPAREGTKATSECAKAYQELYAALKKESKSTATTTIISSYRSYATQKRLFNESISTRMAKGMSKEEAEADSLKTRQKPGYSEHQLGLSFDVSINGNTDHNFHNTRAGGWIDKNCYRFGFIIRYPADKTEITKISYEPWHIRYVGKEHAKYIFEHGLCLEEYIALQEMVNSGV